jgi:uncharacterized protein
MTAQLAGWLVGGGVALCLMALFVVILARSMGHVQAKMPTAAEAIAANLPGGALGAMLKKHVLSSSSDTHEKEAAAKAGKQAGGVVAAIIGAVVSIIVGVAVASEVFEEKAAANIIPIELSAGELHGTLLAPKKNAEIVLIVPGSGPTDRDGNGPALRTNAYKLLAEGLAREGIASVRVDKRGMFGSAGAGNPNDVSIETYAKDYGAWIDTLRAQSGQKCIWLLGHSEGALMVSAAAEGRKDVCGLILVSGMGRKMGDVIRAQLQDNPANAPLLGQAFAALDDLEAGRHTDTSAMHPALLPLFAPPVQDFLISMMAANPVEAVRRARVQTLIVQGTADLQVTLEDAKLLNDAPKTRLRTITGMNHVLKDAPGGRSDNLATYSNPELPVAPRLVAVIEDFIEDED